MADESAARALKFPFRRPVPALNQYYLPLSASRDPRRMAETISVRGSDRMLPEWNRRISYVRLSRNQRCRTSAQGRVESDFWFRAFLTAETETATKLVTTAPICP